MPLKASGSTTRPLRRMVSMPAFAILTASARIGCIKSRHFVSSEPAMARATSEGQTVLSAPRSATMAAIRAAIP
jgi:hypothetical protein